jgi:glycosyltransferase involved in cell wall biosynthesis
MSILWLDQTTLDKEVINHIKNADVLLDIGGGIHPRTFMLPGIHICCEPNSENIHVLENQFSNSTKIIVIKCEAQDIVKIMPDKSIDVIFLNDSVQHFDKNRRKGLMLEFERIARKQIILIKTFSFCLKEHNDDDIDIFGLHGGGWQEYNSGWMPEDFDDSWSILGCREYYSIDSKGEPIFPPFGALWAIKNLNNEHFISLPQKTAVISPVFPPNDSGQAIMLFRLFRQVKPEDYCLISNNNYLSIVFPFNLLRDSLSCLGAKFYYISPEFQSPCLNLHGISLIINRINVLLLLIGRSIKIARIIKQENCANILSCSGDLYDLPSSYLASILCRKPFFAYMFDYYSHQFTQPLDHFLAKIFESIFLKHAKGIIVPNEFLANKYHIKYKVEPTVIHNPIETSELKDDKDLPWPMDSKEISIVYTGQVYQAHYDAFRNLVAAIQQLDVYNVRLHIYTAQPPEALRSQNIDGPVVFHNHLPQNYVREVQRKADILFLPLAFDSPYPEIIKTSAPSKFGEYLSSRRPILAHIPEGSFMSWYIKEYDCGVAIDQNDVGALADAINRILTDADLRKKIIENAFKRAKVDFSIETAHAVLLGVLKSKH